MVLKRCELTFAMRFTHKIICNMPAEDKQLSPMVPKKCIGLGCFMNLLIVFLDTGCLKG